MTAREGRKAGDVFIYAADNSAPVLKLQKLLPG